MPTLADARAALRFALSFAKRVRGFWDAEARERDLQLNHSLVTGLREIRAELSSLNIEQDVAAQRVESLGLAIAQFDQELQRLRAALPAPEESPAKLAGAAAGKKQRQGK